MNMKKTLTSSRETHRWWWSPPPSLSRQKPNAPFLRVRMISVYRPSNTDTRAICEHGVKLIFSSLKRGGGGGAGPRCQETQRKGTKRGGGGGDQVTKGGRGAGGAGCRVSNGLFHKTYRREGLCWHTAFFFRRRRDRRRRSRRAAVRIARCPVRPPSGPPAVRVAAAGRTAAGRTAAGRLPRPIGPGGGGGRKKLTVLYRDDIIIVFVDR